MKYIVPVTLALIASQALAQTAPKVDGTIGAKEYANSMKIKDSGITLYWQVNGDTISFGLTTPAKIWSGIGFNPTGDKKDGADMYMFIMDNGKLVAQDMTMTKPKGEPKLDTKEGCKSDILASAATQNASGMTIEFSRKLNTGDKCDSVLAAGKSAKVLFAVSDNPNVTKAHKKSDHWDMDIVLK